MKKLITMLMTTMISLSILSGCGAKTDAVVPETPTETPTEAKLAGEITFWHSFTQGPRFDAIQKAAEDFMAENPDTKINIEVFSWGDFYTKWTTGLNSGNVPDLSTALPGHVAEMIDVDAIIPLNDLAEKIGIEEFSKAALTEMTVDSKVYALPLYSHAQVMWVRKDLLKAKGLEIPTTWDELYETAKALASDDVYGISVPMGIGDLMATRFLNFYVRSGGETLITEDGKANITSKIAIDGINYWVKMYKELSPKDSVNYKVLDQATLYYQGKTAFDFNSGFQIGGVETNSPDLAGSIDAAPLPTINKGDPAYAAETSNIPMVVWKNSKHPEVAKAFMEYLYEDERYINFLQATPVGMLPALKSISTDERYLSNEKIKTYSNALEVISEAVSLGTGIGFEFGPRPEAGLLTSQGVIEAMFQDIVINGTDVNIAAKTAEDKLNELFETLK